MPGPAYQRFIESMNIGYEQWHDGIGYDMEALAGMTPEERTEAEPILIAHLVKPGDWRDVEAVVALGTPGAIAAVNAARKHRDPKVREYVLETLTQAAPQSAEELEDEIAHAVERGALDLAANPRERLS